MGWIGWTEEQTLQTTIPAIELAYRARCDMLQAIFGGAEDAAPAVSPRPMTPTLFNALFGGGAK